MKRFLPLLGLFLLAAGCSSLSGGISGGINNSGADFGATPGGVQDMKFARELIDQGVVPPPEAVLVEAMFSEHDLPLAGAPCAETLCLRGAVGAAPNRAGKPAAFAQVGMSSSIDPDKFVRPPVSFIATVDVSGSMGWGYGDNSTPGGIARVLLHQIVGELTENDRFALVTYGDAADTALDWTDGNDPDIDQTIDDLHEDGSTNMEAGLKLAFEVADEEIAKGHEVRVLLFTDTQPNVGASTSSEFEQIVGAAAQKGIGVSVLGLGLGMGADVLKGMSHLRGGNAFSLVSPDDVPGFMGDNWPWFTVPIAYDLHLKAMPTEALSFSASYGFPESASGPSAGLDVSTVFLSKRRGALLLELGKAQDAAITTGDGVSLSLSYNDPQGTSHQTTLTPAFDGAPLDARGVSIKQPGLARTVSLALFTTAVRASLEVYAADKEQAVVTLEAALARLTADAAATGDTDLDTEAKFWPKLLDLMKSGAAQSDLYGGF
ncbi:MAG: VWA domain-containing protein [Minicystis sp.]